jgi:hypothetical protein
MHFSTSTQETQSNRQIGQTLKIFEEKRAQLILKKIIDFLHGRVLITLILKTKACGILLKEKEGLS